MSGEIKFSPSAWRKAAQAHEQAGSSATSSLSELVSSTTDASACGAAGGLATVDGAVAMMLTAFGQVMQSEVLDNLDVAMADEAAAMAATGDTFDATEADAVDQAKGTWQ